MERQRQPEYADAVDAWSMRLAHARATRFVGEPGRKCSDHRKLSMKRNRMIGAGLAFGLAAGSLISVFLDDFAFWVGGGICLGMAAGAAWSKLSARGDAASNDEKRGTDPDAKPH